MFDPRGEMQKWSNARPVISKAFLHGVVYVGQSIKLELQDLELQAHRLFPQTSCGVTHFPSTLHFKTDQMVITI